jgi:hypothetical protein
MGYREGSSADTGEEQTVEWRRRPQCVALALALGARWFGTAAFGLCDLRNVEVECPI